MTPRQQQFARDGFVLERVLTDADVEDFRRLMAELLDPATGTTSNEVACSSMQHLGDPLESFGTRAKQYYIHMLGTPRARPRRLPTSPITSSRRYRCGSG